MTALSGAATQWWEAKVRAIEAERDRAIETRENANRVSVRVELENRRLRDAIEQARELAAEAYNDNEDDDSPGNMAFAVLNHALSEEGAETLRDERDRYREALALVESTSHDEASVSIATEALSGMPKEGS